MSQSRPQSPPLFWSAPRRDWTLAPAANQRLCEEVVRTLYKRTRKRARAASIIERTQKPQKNSEFLESVPTFSSPFCCHHTKLTMSQGRKRKVGIVTPPDARALRTPSPKRQREENGDDIESWNDLSEMGKNMGVWFLCSKNSWHICYSWKWTCFTTRQSATGLHTRMAFLLKPFTSCFHSM